MNRQTVLLLIFLVPVCCMAQTTGNISHKAFYKERSYLDNMLYGSANPTSIANSPWDDVMDLHLGYKQEKGSFRLIDEGARENVLHVDVSGGKKTGKLSFEGKLGYRNETAADKKWSNSIHTATGNPFFIADSIASKYTAEKFRLQGGLSYDIHPRWRAGIRISYDVGVMADQTDPRPKTKGIVFRMNPGADFRINDSFTIGLSAEIKRMRESVGYYLVDHLNPKINSIFIMRGLNNPEIRDGYGYTRKYSGTGYTGNIQLLWEQDSFSNFTEIGFMSATEKAEDGSTGFTYLGGDYRSKTYSFRNRSRFQSGQLMHNMTLYGGYKLVDGIWYIQTQTTDKDGNKVWEVRDKSVIYKNDQISASANYRMDMVRDHVPSFSFELEGGYGSSAVHQYPEQYKQSYGTSFLDMVIAKYINVKKGILSLSVNGNYTMLLDKAIDVEGSRLSGIYLIPAFHALASGSYSLGVRASYKIPVKIGRQAILFDLYAAGSIKKYKGDYPLYLDTDRRYFDCGIHLVF